MLGPRVFSAHRVKALFVFGVHGRTSENEKACASFVVNDTKEQKNQTKTKNGWQKKEDPPDRKTKITPFPH